jgi:hypothetical protein
MPTKNNISCNEKIPSWHRPEPGNNIQDESVMCLECGLNGKIKRVDI